MSLSFQWEPLSRVLDNDGLAGLGAIQWAEVGTHQGEVPLDIDWEEYLQREREGLWQGMTGRRDGRMVSYIAFNLFKPARYKSTLFVVEDTVWVVPDEKDRGVTWYRTCAAATRMVPRPCLLFIKSRLTAKDGRSGAILKRLGLEPVETVYSRYLV